ncbi:hypothetical protein KIM372_11190 [Bombiscardovia nodaiensis]|uniref:Alpha/beta hydrolase n=1 Tax=Bombiscardovia nodaiensis TaxID=2932181 RepID=A0ABN6SDC6_9BIFI|nr:hypothetical protein KIM372_11190 [Bombiscardovia nodaiensis]
MVSSKRAYYPPGSVTVFDLYHAPAGLILLHALPFVDRFAPPILLAHGYGYAARNPDDSEPFDAERAADKGWKVISLKDLKGSRFALPKQAEKQGRQVPTSMVPAGSQAYVMLTYPRLLVILSQFPLTSRWAYRLLVRKGCGYLTVTDPSRFDVRQALRLGWNIVHADGDALSLRNMLTYTIKS